MLTDFIVAFILSVPGQSDLITMKAFGPHGAIKSCEEDYQSTLNQAAQSWMLRTLANQPELIKLVGPADLTIKCLPLDHVDPDTQPVEEGA